MDLPEEKVMECLTFVISMHIELLYRRNKTQLNYKITQSTIIKNITLKEKSLYTLHKLRQLLY